MLTLKESTDFFQKDAILIMIACQFMVTKEHANAIQILKVGLFVLQCGMI